MQRARDELAVTLAREAGAGPSRLQDRLDIARDLHDGLGGSLVRMTALVEQSGAPQNRQFLSMLNLLRDLRQTRQRRADMKPPATPREWIAPLRHRYTQLFDELGIEVRWDVPASWIVPPSALQCLALTRLIEEGRPTSSSTAAPGASRCAWRSPTPALELMVEDDGAGFDVAAVCQAGISVGMRSMSRASPGRRQLADRFRARPRA